MLFRIWHGNKAWENIDLQELDQVERFIFLGDYFDSKNGVHQVQQEAENFMSIVSFAHENQNVDLLIGNHDLHYIGGSRCKGHQAEVEGLIRDTLLSLISSRQLKCTASWGRYICSHAGISRVWLQMMRYQEVEEINSVFRCDCLSVDFSSYARHFKDNIGIVSTKPSVDTPQSST